MPELFGTTKSKIVDIKNEIMNDVDHNKPKRECSNDFLAALTMGSNKFSTSKFKEIMTSLREG